VPVSDPAAMFDRLFTAAIPAALRPPDDATGAKTSEQLRADRKSVLDFVSRDIERLRARLGEHDRRRVEGHLDSIREIERSLLVEPSQVGGGCVPAMRQTIAWENPANVPQIGRLQMDLMVAALSCNLTRVALLLWGRTAWTIPFPWVGLDYSMHKATHNGQDDLVVKCQVWFGQQLGYLLGKLKSITEPGGTMLDNTALVWSNEFGDGDAHSPKPVATTLVGGAGGAWKTGRYLKFGARRSYNDLLTSLCHAMGVNVDKFGDPALNTGPITLG
jgi:hypothetical protein